MFFFAFSVFLLAAVLGSVVIDKVAKATLAKHTKDIFFFIPT